MRRFAGSLTSEGVLPLEGGRRNSQADELSLSFPQFLFVLWERGSAQTLDAEPMGEE